METIRIELAFVDAIATQADPTTLNDFAGAAIDELRTSGYVVEPIATGARGLPPFEIVLDLAQRVQENQAFLLELVKLATPIVGALIAASQRKQDAKPAPPAPIEIVVRLDSAMAELRPGAQPRPEQLLEQLLRSDPRLAATATPASKCTVLVRVPPQPPKEL